jgi:Uma2 family endonuclease
MVEKTELETPTQTILPEEAVDDTVSEADYLAQFAADFNEWTDGKVEKMSPVSRNHDKLTRYLLRLFEAYLSFRKIGTVAIAPFVMRLPDTKIYREPDLQLILNTNTGTITDTYMDGPADICIEIVSKSSVVRDHSTKMVDYEQGGVREYWIIDPEHREARFLRMTESGLYRAQYPHATEFYHTPLLPEFAIHIPTLWRDDLPDYGDVWNAVQSMLNPTQNS